MSEGSNLAAGMDVRSRSGGVTLRVRVRLRSRQAGLLGTHDGRLIVGVSAAPEKGKANRAVMEILAETVGVARSELEILSGHGHPDKVILFRGVTKDYLVAQLAGHLPA